MRPAWAMRALIVMLIAGFPFAMLLAWTLDITRKGIARTAPTKFSARHESGIRASILASCNNTVRRRIVVVLGELRTTVH